MTALRSLTFFVSGLLVHSLMAQQQEDLDRVTRISAVERGGHHYASLTGRLLDPEGKPLVGARAILMGYQTFYWALPLGESMTDERGRFRITGIEGTGNPQLWVQSPKRMRYAFEAHRALLIDGEEVDLGDWTPFARLEPTTDGSKPITIRGVILDNKAQPVPQAFVRLEGEGKAYDPGAYAYTDESGRFRIESRASTVEWMSIFAGGRRFRIKHDASKKEMGSAADGWGTALSMALTGEEIELKLTELQAIPLPGRVGRPRLSYFSRFGGQLHPWSAKRVFLARSQYGSSLEVIVSRDGHLPRPHTFSLNKVGKPKFKTPYFGKNASFNMQFMGLSKQEIGHVKLDISLLRGDHRESSVSLGRFDLDAKGDLGLMGMADAVYEVHAYLKGHDPILAWWRGGEPLQLRFTKRTQQVAFRSAGKGRSLRIKLPGSFRPIAVLALDGKGEGRCLLAPGKYETTLYDAEGRLIAARSMSVGNEPSVTDIDLEQDERPRVRLLLPKGRVTKEKSDAKEAQDNAWHVAARREAIGGMVSDWAASSGGRPLRSGEESVIVTKKKANEYELRFPTSGPYFLYCGQGQLPGRFFLRLDLDMGDQLVAEFPKRPAILDARTANYHPSGFSHHGTAGPRFLLWPHRSGRKARGWGIFIGLPDLADDGSFRVEGLPAGEFTLFHHLAGKDTEYTDSEGKKSAYNQAFHIWGGQPADLAPTGATDLGELSNKGLGSLDIQVTDKTGKPIPFGYLEVRDPMFDSWNKVLQGGSTRDFATDPIPAPPSARIQLGKSRLEHIRKGRLLLRVLLPGGLRVTLERDVVPGKGLELRLPIPR